MTRTTLLAVFCLAAALTAPPCIAAEPTNLLNNGGFEDGTTGWSLRPQHELVEDPAASHRGNACLTGAVTGPNQALRLKRQVAVKAGNRYELIVWARATNRTKLVIIVTQPGSNTRQNVAVHPFVPAKWTQYRTSLPVQGSGTLGLEIISPSSFSSPAGQIWIDDVALFETEMPPVTSVPPTV